ncbi:MAG: C-GCAxxG-C-C family protein [Desulfotomaculaceae bacterium]
MHHLSQQASSKAGEYFDRGYNCAQTVALSNIELLGGHAEGVLQLAAGFGHGMNAGCTCGALAGGVMALGMLLAEPGVTGFDKPIARAATELNRRFISEFGVTCCRSLRKKLSPLKNARCRHITTSTAAMTMELLQAEINAVHRVSV